MAEDLQARSRLFEELQRKKLEEIPPSTFDERIIKFQENIGIVLVKIFKLLDKPFEWPKSFQIHGSVKVKEIEKMPAIKVENFRELKPEFDQLRKQIGLLTHAISLISQQPPKAIPTQTIIQKDPELNDLIRQLIEKLDSHPNNIKL